MINGLSSYCPLFLEERGPDAALYINLIDDPPVVYLVDVLIRPFRSRELGFEEGMARISGTAFVLSGIPLMLVPTLNRKPRRAVECYNNESPIRSWNISFVI